MPTVDDIRLLNTVEFLLDSCFVNGGFFQDMIHSGVNPYLTLHIAQVLLRAGDSRYFRVANRVAELASPTGQWPEAVHPRTGGGCMGDGQHAWAASEWLQMVRHCFVQEESDQLWLLSGVPQAWLQTGAPIEFGPTPTRFGRISIRAESENDCVQVSWQADWHRPPASIVIRLPGFAPLTVPATHDAAHLTRCARQPEAAAGVDIKLSVPYPPSK